MDIKFRWFGTAGIEIDFDSTILLIDPYLTRHSLGEIVFSRLMPDEELFKKYITRGDHIFITHSHFDHISDVAAINKTIHADVYASQLGADILLSRGVRSEKLHIITAGKPVINKYFKLDPIPGKHLSIFGLGNMGMRKQKIYNLPLRSFNYHMDVNYNFLFTIEDLKLLDWGSTTTDNLPTADILFIKPQMDVIYKVVEKIRPRLLIPIHWDEFWKKDVINIQPMPFYFSKEMFKVMRLDWKKLQMRINEISPKTCMLIPEFNKIYNIQDYI